MLKSIIRVMRDKRGISNITELMIIVGIIAVVATGVGTTLQDSLETGATSVGALLDAKFATVTGP